MKSLSITHEETVDFFATLYGGRRHIPGGKYTGDNVKPWGAGSWQGISEDEDVP